MPTLALEALRGLTGRLVTLGLLHGLWIGLLVASFAAFALRFLPNRARLGRHRLLLAALMIVAVGPIAAAWLQRSLTATALPRSPDGPVPTVIVTADRVPDGPGNAKARPTPRPSSTSSSVKFPIYLSSIICHDIIPLLQPFLLAAWLVGVATLAAILILGMISASRMRSASGTAGAAIQSRAERLADRLGLKRCPPVLVHPGLVEPCLVGVFRPAVLLPGAWLEGAGDGPLEAILAHELAHARRRDLPVSLVQRGIEAAFFFHPSVHWLSRMLRRQRELCADALAVAITGDPLALAVALESVARLRGSPRPNRPLGAALGGETSSLLSRVQELLGMTPTRPPVRLWPLVSLPVAALFALLSTSLGLADDPPAPAPPEAPATAAPQPEPLIHPGKSAEIVYSPIPAPHPFSVSTEQASQLQAAAASPLPAPHPFSVSTEQAPAIDRLISFEVRFVSGLEASRWRSLLMDRIPLVDQQPNVSAWMLDERAVVDLCQVLQQNLQGNLIQAPKITAFEGTPATIFNTAKQHYIAGVEKIESPKYGLGYRPITKSLEIGCTLTLSGKLHPGGTQVDLDLRDTSIVAMHSLTREDEYRGKKLAARYQVPSTAEKHFETLADIPEGSTLAISLGLYEKPGRISEAAQVALGLLESLGAPPLEPSSAVCERLILITPRRIVLEKEEEHPSISANAAPQPQSSDR